MLWLGSIVHGLQHVTEQFFSAAGGIVGDILRHHDTNGTARPLPEDDSLTKMHLQQECLNAGQETTDAESVEDIEDGLQLVSLEKNRLGLGRVFVETAEQGPNQREADNPLAKSRVDQNEADLDNIAVHVVESASSESIQNGLEQKLLILNKTTNETTTDSTIKTANTSSIPEAKTDDMVLTFAMNKRDTCESNHATSPAECASQSKGPTGTAEPPIMTSNITKLPVPMTTDLTNIKLRARGSAESSKCTAHVPTSSPKGTTTVPRRHMVIDLSADAKTIVKVPKTRKTTAAALKPPPVKMENKMGLTRAGRKRNRKRRGNRCKRNQNAAPSVCDAIELRLSKKETRKRKHSKRNQRSALSVSDHIELRLAKNETLDFTLRVIALWEKGAAAEWMRRVSDRELYLLGGDRNFLFELLFHHEILASISSQVAIDVMHAASQRVDLFSEKQLSAITELAEACVEEKDEDSLLQACWEETENQSQLRATRADHRGWVNSECHDASAAKSGETKVLVVDGAPISRQIDNTPVKPISRSYAPSEALRLFLIKQHGALKGNPEYFCHWLWILGIFTIADLASAATSNDALWNALQKGNGKTGVKKFKSSGFKNAVLAAALSETSEMPEELLCPISQVVFRDPVVASDGHTSERVAIHAWFQKQVSKIEATKQTFGLHSPQAQAVMRQGVQSPITYIRLPHLVLTPNHAMVQAFASNEKMV